MNDPVARRRDHQADVEYLLRWHAWLRGIPFWLAIAIVVLLALAACVSLVLLASGGPEPRAKWGYAAATLAFLLQTCSAAPLLPLTARLAKGLWAAPLHRIAEL